VERRDSVERLVSGYNIIGRCGGGEWKCVGYENEGERCEEEYVGIVGE